MVSSRDGGGLDIDGAVVAGADFVDQAFGGFAGQEVAAVDAVAEEDAGVELGDDDLDAGLGQGQRGVLARGAAAEVLAADDDRVVAILNCPLATKGTWPLGRPDWPGGTPDMAYMPKNLRLLGVRGVVATGTRRG